MSISDAYVDVTCDKCMDCERMELDYTYFDYSGKSGCYDTTESGLAELLESMGWSIDGDICTCEGCIEEAKSEKVA